MRISEARTKVRANGVRVTVGVLAAERRVRSWVSRRVMSARLRLAGMLSQSGARLAGVHPVSIATADEWAAMVLYWITETLRVADANAALVAANVALTDAAAVLLAAHEGLRSEADEAFAELSVRRAYDARESDLFSVQERIVELSRMARNPWAPVVTHVKERNGNGNH